MNTPDKITSQVTYGPLEFLAGGGEMGERIRSMDWASTPLGPADKWPQSLKTCVRIILTSRQPMFVWWGKELINLYNDAYKAIVGGKHPVALGQPASVVWREIWGQVGPRAEQVMLKNEGTYDESLLLIMERNGYPEETYYTFSYSPVPGDLGGTEGIICANTDDTLGIIGERQLALLRDLAARTVNARTTKEACLHSATSLRTNLTDLPFSMLYLYEEESEIFKLAGTSGIEAGHLVAPLEVDIHQDDSPWPFADVMQNNKLYLISDINRTFKNLPFGTWYVPPRHGVIIPIAQSGHSVPAGLLIAGLNPFRLYDNNYEGFIKLVATQIASALGHARAYEEERERAEALAEIDRAKTVFFSNISHEFRTPLTLMLGPLESLLNNPTSLSPTEREELSTVHRNSLRLLKLVNTLLDFSRIEAGRIQAEFRETDLSSLTHDLSSAFRSAIENAGLKFNFTSEPIADPVYVDITMWERIVFNLLSNAFKFTFEGEISVGLKQENKVVKLSIRDTGTGIPEKELSKLFTRFHRIENAAGRTHEGSGIGLAMVQELVKLHGGTIKVNSAEGEGSEFIVTIPTGNDHLPPGQIVTETTSQTATLNALPNLDELGFLNDSSPQSWQDIEEDSFSGKKEKILVADDNSDMRQYLKRLLDKEYEVLTASDGLEALKLLEKEEPSLILSDIMMPNLDGLGLLERLRANEATKTLPVIFLSARAGDEAKIEGIQAGADDYLVKPFAAKELLARVQTNLKMARLRKQTQEEMKQLSEAERALHSKAEEDRKKLYKVFMQSPAMVCILRGPHHVFELINPPYQRLFGSRTLLGRPIKEALPELEGQPLFDLLDYVYTTGNSHVGKELQVFLAREDDRQPEEVYFNFNYEALRNDKNEIDGIFMFAYEVTEQVVSRKILQDYNDRIRTIMESLPMISWTAEADGKPTYFNQTWYKYTGLSIEESALWRTKDFVHPEDLPAVNIEWNDAFNQKRQFEIEYRIRRNLDGMYRWHLGRSLPILNAQGVIVRWVGTATDIHDRRMAQDQLKAFNIELSEKNRQLTKINNELDNFVYTASHDLKAPIANLEGLLVLLKKNLEGQLEERNSRIFEMMDKSIHRFRSTILDLTEISKVQVTAKEDFEEVKFEAMLEEVKTNINQSIIQSDATIVADFKVEEINFSKKDLNSILYNLLSNAIKYHAPDRRPMVEVKTKRKGDQIILSVKDNGLGFDLKYRDKLFAMFRRLHNHVEGTGVGLYIVKKIIENNNGRIEVESEVGRGSTFTIYFIDK